jgi:hypothetical protein
MREKFDFGGQIVWRPTAEDVEGSHLKQFMDLHDIVWFAAPTGCAAWGWAKRTSFVGDLPKTRDAKVMLRIIRSAYFGEDQGNRSSLVNSETIGDLSRVQPTLNVS